LPDKKKEFPVANGNLVEKLIQEIQKKSEKREDLLQKSKKLPRPSNRDIADIVGLPEDQINQISNILIRARKKIQENIEIDY